MTGDPLIAAEELADRLPDVTVLDVRWRLGGPSGRAEHAAGRVPGARYVDLEQDLADPLASAEGVGPAGRHPLPSPARFADAMRRCGVRMDRPVVAYDDWQGRAAARLWWLLRRHGHGDVRVLDGGWAVWQAGGRPHATGEVPPPRSGDVPRRAPAGTSRSPGVVDADAVPTVGVLVDARDAARFRGEEEPVDPVAGHVPGAVNVPTGDNLGPDGRFLPAERLRERYAAAGAVPGSDVAVYCGSGVTACHDLLALERVGVDAALYPGSWSGWVSDPARPVERD